MIDSVIFDLDGTLLDTLEDLFQCCNYALKINGFPQRTREEIRLFVGNGFANLIERAVPDGRSNPLYQKVFDDAKGYYDMHSFDNTKLYDGIAQMLDTLRSLGIKTGIVSNKPDDRVKDLCSMYFASYMQKDVAVGQREGVKIKPSPDSVIEVMKILHADKERTLYVGDSDVDIKTAFNAGLKGICVTWGFRDRDFLEANGAEVLIDKPQELIDIIKQN